MADDPVPSLLREIIQGLALMQDGLNVMDARLVVIEEALTKEIGPSETAKAIETLAAAVATVGEAMVELSEAVRDGLLEPEEDADHE